MCGVELLAHWCSGRGGRKQEDHLGGWCSNPEGDGDILDEATSAQVVTQRVSAIALGEEEADEVIQAFVVELEMMWVNKIQRDKAVERGGLGSQAGCWVLFTHRGGKWLTS